MMDTEYITDACDWAIEALEEHLNDDAIETDAEAEKFGRAVDALEELRAEAQKREYPTPTQQLYERVSGESVAPPEESP